MTQDEIIRMAREVGCDNYGDCYEFVPETLERFAAIVAENTGIKQQREIVRLKAIIEEQANGAQNLVLAEREACAKVCDESGLCAITKAVGTSFAAAIRAREE